MISVDSVKVKDKYISALLHSLTKKTTFKIDKSLISELNKYLSVVPSLKGKIKKIPYGSNGPSDLKAIGMLLSKTQKYKDRVREIDIRFLELEYALDDLKTIAINYLWDNYGDDLADMKPVARQSVFIDAVLSDICKILSEICLLREKAQIVLQNLTDSYWTLSKVQEIGVAFIPPHLNSRGHV